MASTESYVFEIQNPAQNPNLVRSMKSFIFNSDSQLVDKCYATRKLITVLTKYSSFTQC
jgi:hypothetical protein